MTSRFPTFFSIWEAKAKLKALRPSQVIIEFDLDGAIQFSRSMGYTTEEIRGKHHSLFVDEAFRSSQKYTEFWEALRRGKFQAAEYKRIGKGSQEVWLQATYNPVLGRGGKPKKVPKVATDITRARLEATEHAGKIAAIGKSQAVIEFELDGTQNFLDTVGYDLADTRGKHHSIFVEPKLRGSAEYSEFCAALHRGEYRAGEFKRLGKDGKDVWIQGAYNTILGLDGRPFKVIKYATDVTAAAQERMRRAALGSEVDKGLAAIADSISAAIKQAAGAASASVQTSSNVQAVAAGAEEVGLVG